MRILALVLIFASVAQAQGAASTQAPRRGPKRGQETAASVIDQSPRLRPAAELAHGSSEEPQVDEARAQTGGALVALGLGAVFEQASDGESFEVRQPWALRAGYRFTFADILTEYSSYRVSSGSSIVSLRREHRELLAWAHRNLYERWSRLYLYAGAGAGAAWELIDTNFAGGSARDPGALEPIFALTLGVRAVIIPRVALSLEGRAGLAPNYAPKPLPSLSTFLVYRF